MVFQCLIFVVDRHYCSSVSTSYGFFNSSLRTLIARTHTYIKLCASHHSQCFTYITSVNPQNNSRYYFSFTHFFN